MNRAANPATKMIDFEATSLYRISQLPLDPDAEIFRHYPALKLGVTKSVRHYARLMLSLLKETIASDSERADWVLTAPAISARTPAAANLLCWELFDLYMRERDRSNSNALSLIDIRHDSESMASIDWKDPTKSQDYAELDFADRLTERERSNRRMIPNADFRERSILFVNDMCVTGAQQHVMQKYFERAGAACVRWLYVIVVDPEIGRTTPRIEWQINFAPFKDLLRMVSREQIQFTGKCVQRLMGLSIDELERVLRALDGERRTRLLELAVLNGFQNLDGFQEQLELVRSYSTEGNALGQT
ncbi:MAG TPA: phosphoribosyltransferase family protein [Pyrinomonadaceae bacterium]|nr:phosphoribosyltransferase family protein [Pyrinomonadaceae bacterium]